METRMEDYIISPGKLSAAHSCTSHPPWVSGDEVISRHYLPHFIDRETEVLKA